MSLTLGQFLDRWLDDYVKPRREPKTYQSYAQQIRTHLRPALGKHKLKMLTAQHIDRFLSRQLEQGLSARTVQYQRQILSSALSRAVSWGLVSRNVARLTEPPTV